MQACFIVLYELNKQKKRFQDHFVYSEMGGIFQRPVNIWAPFHFTDSNAMP